ncbi:uncharacterized protein LOC125824260 [Solanum verrucosum]|uniref:uncharacterized protein LOC125824260 n=1 Tax=Solanum verrucosum TaxID=315347 RepID=UPI0020D0B739|nr:uncharacterized protein LOC125824260 [Solanum verrucosum]
MTQVNREVVAPANPISGMGVARIREFLRMNTLEFSGSKVEEDPNRFIEEVYMILSMMGVTTIEKAELATYQLKDVAQIWYEQWKDSRLVGVSPIEWEVFKSAFLERFFPRELRDAKMEEFINLKQERFKSKISSLEESKDLSTISVEELISALQVQEQRSAFMQDNVTEGAFYAQNRKEKENYPLCKYCKRKMHLEKICWWRPDTVCGNGKQAGHVTKVCKLKNNLQAQVVEAKIEE